MQLMSIDDLAVYLGDSKRTIYKYIASGDCPPYIKISTKNIKFDRADVDAWLESKKVIQQTNQLSIKQKALRWMPRAKQAVKLAEQEAKQCRLDYVGTEHLLLGILGVEDCIGAIVLKNLGVDCSKLQELYEQLCNSGSVSGDNKKSDKKLSLMNTAQMAIRCATGEAIRLGHTYIGTEHLLQGILHISGGLGCGILTQLGVTLESVLSETAKLILCKNVKQE